MECKNFIRINQSIRFLGSDIKVFIKTQYDSECRKL